MKVVIAGAGSVGRSIARELIAHHHEVLLIDKSAAAMKRDRVPSARWLLADACEMAGLNEAQLEDADVVVAATGDDKTNLVMLLIAKTEFAVPRTVGRVNNPKNEWLFDESWGVDVAVSTPRLMTALVEEAVEIGGLVRLLTFEQGKSGLVEFTVHQDSPIVGKPVGSLALPEDAVLVAVLRSSRALAPTPDDILEAGDELFFITTPGGEVPLLELLAPSE
ncbi:TrkA family potassium uptake protein [Saxibacter everestensis]|uniref:Trk system potassium uptake protein TrkA n=1 Tax=Saxibacter everestensis TaxID=2909229 RepID=A0ABY8QY29_9MICO|nr:TrkA family potassium uptake protein [Brevibacteriaceae bacterium ZFBP1038]